MADYKTYTLVVMSAILMASLGLNTVPDANYACDSKQIKAYCYDLSSSTNRCYIAPAKASYRDCGEGWKKIEVFSEEKTGKCPIIVAYTDEGKYYCTGIGEEQTCIKKDDLVMPFG